MAKKTKAQVQFEADTSGFTQGIKDVDKSLSTMRNELKLNSAELKENGNNVDLLSQRQDILQKEHDESIKKVEMLESKLELAKSQFGDNSQEVYKLTNQLLKAKTEFQGIQNEITQTDNRMTQLEQGTNQLEGQLENVADSTDKLGEGFTITKGVIADLVSNGIQSLIGSLNELVIEGDTAMSKFQGQTGLSTKEMSKFKEQIEDLYANNYGESIDDIASAMAEVKQQTKEVDPSKVKDLTKNAIVLRDTFDMDIQESMRAVNMLTAQFGITGEEAFNLIVQGAQNGLDKNGDLLDSINEYSVHYSQLGFTSEQFFNSLVNGTGAGTFSVDKLGDAMKEFGIRSKDTAASTDEGFKLIGLNADKMRQKFSQGGESAQRAFDETLTALMSVDDQVKQNQAGVDLFGTMWEDLGIDGVSALSDVTSWTENTNVAIDKSKKSMEELDQIRYDNFSSEMSAIGRSIQMDFIVPLMENLIPSLKQGLIWIKDNLGTIIPIVSILGIAISTYFVVGKIMSFVGIITQVISLVKTGTGVFTAFNTVLTLNPIGLIVAAIAGLIAIFVLLWNKCEWFRNFWINLWNGIVGFSKGAIDTTIGFFKGIINFFKNNWQGILLFISNPFAGAFKLLYDNCDGFRNFIDGTLSKIKKNISSIFNGIKNVTVNTWNGVKNGIERPINRAKDIVKNGIDKIKSMFNFQFKWPKLKMPHFSIKGSMNPIDWVKKGVPKLKVDWYASGAIFTKPTLFNTASGIKGVAEAGAEGILPISNLESWIYNALYHNNAQMLGVYNSNFEKLIQVAEQILAKDSNMYMNGRKVSEALSNSNDSVSGELINLKGRGLVL